MSKLSNRPNNLIFWRDDLFGFQDNKPVWNNKLGWAYHTLTTDLFLFSDQEWKLVSPYIENGTLRADTVSLTGSKHAFFENVFKHLYKSVSSELEKSPVFSQQETAEIWLQANHFCNLACPGCATGMDVFQDWQKKFDPVVVEQCLKKVVHDAKEREFKHLKVKIGGGEPTLNGVEFLKGVAGLCELYSDGTISLRPILLTNGIALSDQLIQTLKDRDIHSSVSTDPFRTIGKGRTKAWPLVLENIKKMKAAGASVSAQLTVSGLNHRMVGEIYEQLARLEVPIHYSMFRPQTKGQFAYAKPEQLIEGMMDVYARAFQRIERGLFFGNIFGFDYLDIGVSKPSSCGAGNSYIVLDVNGDIYSCHETIRSGNPAGNVLRDNASVFDMISEKHPDTSSAKLAQEARVANPFVWQGGVGCPWMRERESGTIESVSRIVMEVYNALAPVLLALTAKWQRLNYVLRTFHQTI